MAGYHLTDKADADIDNIFVYSVENFGLERARTYVFGLHDTFDILAENELIGIDVGNIKFGHRRHMYESHSIYYRIDDHGIEIMRVLHMSQDALRNLQ